MCKDNLRPNLPGRPSSLTSRAGRAKVDSFEEQEIDDP